MSIISDQLVVLVDPGTLSAGANQAAVSFPVAVDILGVTPAVATAGTGGNVEYDLLVAGASVLTAASGDPTIVIGGSTGAEVIVPAANRRVDVGEVVSISCILIGDDGAATPTADSASDAALTIRYRAAADTPTN